MNKLVEIIKNLSQAAKGAAMTPPKWAGQLAITLSTFWVPAIMTMTVILFILFCLGFILNGFWGFTFNLDVIWSGLGAISAASITGLGKYFVDSLYNSNKGEPPSP